MGFIDPNRFGHFVDRSRFGDFVDLGPRQDETAQTTHPQVTSERQENDPIDATTSESHVALWGLVREKIAKIRGVKGGK
jgi:hypothetical protein